VRFPVGVPEDGPGGAHKTLLVVVGNALLSAKIPENHLIEVNLVVAAVEVVSRPVSVQVGFVVACGGFGDTAASNLSGGFSGFGLLVDLGFNKLLVFGFGEHAGSLFAYGSRRATTSASHRKRHFI